VTVTLVYTITETINTLFPVVLLLKCVVTEVLFSIVAFRHISQSCVATHVRCAGVFSDSRPIITIFS